MRRVPHGFGMAIGAPLGVMIAFSAYSALCAQPTVSVLNLGGDKVRMVHGVRTACASEDFEQAQIGAAPYSMRIAVTENGNYVPPRITLSQNDQPLVRVVCKSDWVMFGLEPGAYAVSAAMPDGTSVSKHVEVPKDGVVRTALGREKPAAPTS